MISERQLAGGFDDLWRDVCPLLRPNLVATFNRTYKRKITNANGFELGTVLKTPGTRVPVVAELGFFLASKQVELGKKNSEIRSLDSVLEKCKGQALERISRFHEPTDDRQVDEPVTDSELSESLDLALRYEIHFRYVPQNEIQFFPPVPGTGFIRKCEADIATHDCLWEVKAVNRNIAAKDIKQLLVYLALSAATGHLQWTHGGFFNPRRSQYFRFEIERFVRTVSAGRSARDVFHEIVSYCTSREIQVDAKF